MYIKLRKYRIFVKYGLESVYLSGIKTIICNITAICISAKYIGT